MKARLLYLKNENTNTNYVAIDTSGFDSWKKLSGKYDGLTVIDVIKLGDITARFDNWPTDRLLSDS